MEAIIAIFNGAVARFFHEYGDRDFLLGEGRNFMLDEISLSSLLLHRLLLYLIPGTYLHLAPSLSLLLTVAHTYAAPKHPKLSSFQTPAESPTHIFKKNATGLLWQAYTMLSRLAAHPRSPRLLFAIHNPLSSCLSSPSIQGSLSHKNHTLTVYRLSPSMHRRRQSLSA